MHNSCSIAAPIERKRMSKDIEVENGRTAAVVWLWNDFDSKQNKELLCSKKMNETRYRTEVERKVH